MDLALVGKRIKSARLEKRFTLEKLSEKIGISRNFLWEIEAGRKAPAIQTLYNIGKELNLSVDFILGLSNDIKWLGSEIELNINEIIKELNDKEIKTLYALLQTYSQHK